MRCEFNPEAGQSRLAFTALLRRLVGEPLAGSLVDLACDGGAIGLREASQALALREVLAHQAMGILTGSASPGLVRGREVEVGFGPLLDHWGTGVTRSHCRP
jgi:hypothetical protein